MTKLEQHLIQETEPLSKALSKLNDLAQNALLFLVNERNQVTGSLTDGDVRRGILKNLTVDDEVINFANKNPKTLSKENYSIHEIIALREDNIKIIPVVNAKNEILSLINFKAQKSYLPLDAIVMAGGRGRRLSPLTDTVPKPLLKVGDKPIIDHNIDRLRDFGIDDYHISVRYLGQMLETHFEKSIRPGETINIVWENDPLGTIGAVSNIEEFHHDHLLLTNSDILTRIDYEDFFLHFLENEADMSVASIPYQVDVPYAVMEISKERVVSFKEKPTYTYYSNGGIYLMKRELIDLIPKNQFFNATDLMDVLIKSDKKLITYPLHKYWLDIGKHEDFKKAKEDVVHLDF